MQGSYWRNTLAHGGARFASPMCALQLNSRVMSTGSIMQVEAWKPVVRAVKKKGCSFILQLWHVGRASHQGGGQTARHLSCSGAWSVNSIACARACLLAHMCTRIGCCVSCN